VSQLESIEAIKQLKYRYFRFLDSKQWDELATCFTDDATAAYDDGKYAFTGREAILGFLHGALGSHDIVSLHQGHHPEIVLAGDTRAEGRWSLSDYLIFRESNTRLRGAAYYRDEYVRSDGEWKISHTGYVRLFEEMWAGKDPEGWRLTSFGKHLKSTTGA
jgi:ketosteroid isomerase-like protein